MPDSKSAQKKERTIEATLLSTFGPKTTIVGNVTSPYNIFCVSKKTVLTVV